MNNDNLEEQCDYFFKIVLVGECDVGKTCIWKNYVKNQIPKTTVPTIGAEFEVRQVVLPDGTKIKAQIWDTAGQERYRALTSNHFRKSVGAFLVYDMTSKASFDHLTKWYDDLKKQAEPDIQLYLVGNKLDLIQKNPNLRQVDEHDVKEFSKLYGCKSFEISALTSEKLNSCFEGLFQDLCKQKNGFRGGEQSQMKLMRQSNAIQDKNCKC